MTELQSNLDLENWNKDFDPWGYENNPEDKKRKEILLSEIPPKDWQNVLDIGCGHGFITRDLKGKSVTGIDISSNAISFAKKYETDKLQFIQGSIFNINKILKTKFDLIIITGVLYPQYIGESSSLIYRLIDGLLEENGFLISVHVDEWYRSRFPYLLRSEYYYSYRDYTHLLEIYIK